MGFESDWRAIVDVAGVRGIVANALNHAIWVIFLTAISILMLPYVFGDRGDHLVYLNYVARYVDGSLYPNDFIFDNNRQIDAELVSSLIGVLARLLGSIRDAYYVVFVLAVLAHVTAVYFLVSLFLRVRSSQARRIDGLDRFHRQVTLVVVLIVVVEWPPFRMGFLPMTPTMVALALLAWAIYAYLANRYILATLVTGVSVYANPTYSLLLGPVLVIASWTAHRSWRTALIQLGSFAVIVAPFVVLQAVETSGPILVSQDFASMLAFSGEGSTLLQGTTSDWFWRCAEPLSWGGLLFLSARAAGHKSLEIEQKLLWLLAMTLTAMTLFAVTASFWPVRQLVEARVERIIFPVTAVVMMGCIANGFRGLRWWEAVAALCVCIVSSGFIRNQSAAIFSDVFPDPAVHRLVGLIPLAIFATYLLRRMYRPHEVGTKALPDFAYVVQFFLLGLVIVMFLPGISTVQFPGVAGFALLIWLCWRITHARRVDDLWHPSRAEALFAAVVTLGAIALMNPMWRAASWRGSQESYQEIWGGGMNGFPLVLVVGALLVLSLSVARWLTRRSHVNKLGGAATLILPVIAAFLLGNVSYNPHPMYGWIQENTSVESVFLVPFGQRLPYSRFRYWAERSPYVVEEDNAAVLYSDTYLNEFNRRKAIQEGWEQLNGDELAAVVAETNVDYVLGQDHLDARNLRLVYEAAGEFLYVVEEH